MMLSLVMSVGFCVRMALALLFEPGDSFNSWPKNKCHIKIVGLISSAEIYGASKPESFITVDKGSDFLLDVVFVKPIHGWENQSPCL